MKTNQKTIPRYRTFNYLIFLIQDHLVCNENTFGPYKVDNVNSLRNYDSPNVEAGHFLKDIVDPAVDLNTPYRTRKYHVSSALKFN